MKNTLVFVLKIWEGWNLRVVLTNIEWVNYTIKSKLGCTIYKYRQRLNQAVFQSISKYFLSILRELIRYGEGLVFLHEIIKICNIWFWCFWKFSQIQTIRVRSVLKSCRFLLKIREAGRNYYYTTQHLWKVCKLFLTSWCQLYNYFDKKMKLAIVIKKYKGCAYINVIFKIFYKITNIDLTDDTHYQVFESDNFAMVKLRRILKRTKTSKIFEYRFYKKLKLCYIENIKSIIFWNIKYLTDFKNGWYEKVKIVSENIF
jgi:hypothetical protein